MMNKVIATVLSVGMLLSPVGSAEARLRTLTAVVDVLVNGQQATWNKYAVTTGKFYQEDPKNPQPGGLFWTVDDTQVLSFYPRYAFSKEKGYYGTGDKIDIRLSDIKYSEYLFGGTYYYFIHLNLNNSSMVSGNSIEYSIFGEPGAHGLAYTMTSYNNNINRLSSSLVSGEIKGDFIESVTTRVGTYPDEGAQDGFWYELQCVVED